MLSIAVFWTVAIALAAATVLVARRGERAEAASKAWPTVEGRIVKAEVVARADGQWAHQVSYTYTVAGVGHASDRIQLGGRPYFWSKDLALEQLAAFREGAPVTVHHDPARPDSAVLRLESTGVGAVAVLGLLTFGALVGAVAATIGELTR